MARNSYSSGCREIPKRRGKANEIAAIIVGILCMIYLCVVWMIIKVETLGEGDIFFQCMYNSLSALPVMLVCTIITKWFFCSFVLIEEQNHTKSRYDGNSWLLFKNCFQVFLTRNFVLGVVFSIVIVILVISSGTDSFYKFFVTSCLNSITAIGVSIITNYIFDFKTLSVVELSELDESSNTNVAKGLAWSYFTGYLKIILNDLKQTVENDVRWKQKLENKTLKCVFYAIVPLNCKVPADLIEYKEGITRVGELQPVSKNRAGMKREYTIPVYKIEKKNNEPPFFVICGYVTIIDTLFEMTNFIKFEEKKREEQCLLFIRTLQELIDDNCEEKCEIVTLSGDDSLIDALYKKREKENKNEGGETRLSMSTDV
ncbi:stimulator of interferon genes protein 3-like [Antedon mediterranea]|uniref:stimulator of interferon genes protein 3-like n=1 Tax=Antedon mediterranea TaxID=105859 RepID=UPI003AF60DDC